MKLLVFVFVSAIVGLANGDASIDNDLYQIEQSVDSSDFFAVGQVNIRLLKQTQNAAQYQNLDSELNDKPALPLSTEKLSTELETFKLDKTLIDRIEANRHNNNSIYYIRMCRKVLPNQAPKCFTSTFTYLWRVVESNMAFNLIIHTGLNNNLNSIAIKPWSSGKTGSRVLDRVSVYASVQSIRQASGPDTESYLEKLRIEKEQKEKQAQGGNESFLSKYWMYIVPFVIVMFLMNIVNPEAGGPGGGGGGGGGR